MGKKRKEGKKRVKEEKARRVSVLEGLLFVPQTFSLIYIHLTHCPMTSLGRLTVLTTEVWAAYCVSALSLRHTTRRGSESGGPCR